MTGENLFQLFDDHCRKGALGASSTRLERTGEYEVRIGEMAFVSSWSFDSLRAPAVVSEVIGLSRSLSLPALWRVFDGDTPENLPGTLAGQGFSRISEDVLMAFDLANDVPAPAYDAVQVRDEDQLDQFLDILSQAFGERLAPSPSRRKALLASDEVRLFYARDSDGPITAGLLDISPEAPVVLLRSGSTLPEWRGRGGYASLVRTRLQIARQAGKRAAFVEAMPSSRPILEHLGFVPVRAGVTWRYDPGLD